ncbi:Adenylate and Guanylate cyclase catalytic domain [Carpediemonas membranifera]|uniref:adenylate cyclase n=1 Tax=Carpediemonas membranifera TaxID=201153 RepID=A0A8J6AWI3_9EUKA|nr:Adenylate and Guanylate cyclase catalytic domain [Carpediemonas membranifera]|eukprot:KAG9396616.1 Adenylate and Guanylate cyclase catalytic domain [Carpediemonas membranifera]
MAALFIIISNAVMLISDATGRTHETMLDLSFLLMGVTRASSIVIAPFVILIELAMPNFLLRIPAYHVLITLLLLYSTMLYWLLLYQFAHRPWPYLVTPNHWTLFILLCGWVIPSLQVTLLAVEAMLFNLAAAGVLLVMDGWSSRIPLQLGLNFVAIVLAVVLQTRQNFSLRKTHRASTSTIALAQQVQLREEAIQNHLLATVPAHILSRLEAGESTAVSDYPASCIIFLTVMPRRSLPLDAEVTLLNECFLLITEFVRGYGLIRVKTVGHTLMLFTDTIIPSDLSHLLISMYDPISFIATPVALKAGVAVGPVSGGVIGKLRFQFDVWGTVVNAAARMESLARAGSVVLTEAAFKVILSDPGEALQMAPVAVKGLGTMQPWVMPLLTNEVSDDESIEELTLSPASGLSSAVSTPRGLHSRSHSRFDLTLGTPRSSNNTPRASTREMTDLPSVLADLTHVAKKFEFSYIREGFVDGSVQREFRAFACARSTSRLSPLVLVLAAMTVLIHDIDFIFFFDNKATATFTWAGVAVALATFCASCVCAGVLAAIIGKPHPISAAVALYCDLAIFFIHNTLFCAAIRYASADYAIEIDAYLSLVTASIFLRACMATFFDFVAEPFNVIAFGSMYLCNALVFGLASGWALHAGVGGAASHVINLVIIAVFGMKIRMTRCGLIFRTQSIAEETSQRVHVLENRKVALLELIYPKRVCDCVLAGRQYGPEFFQGVGVLVFDVVDFTHWSSTHGSVETIEMLNWLYHLCDMEVVRMAGKGVNKIKTCGDAYIIACGAPEPCDLPVDTLVKLAFLLAARMEAENENWPDIRCRFGISYGDAMGAVMGCAQTSIFDLFGPTVTEAERMQAAGEPGKVMLSARAERHWTEGALRAYHIVQPVAGGYLVTRAGE